MRYENNIKKEKKGKNINSNKKKEKKSKNWKVNENISLFGVVGNDSPSYFSKSHAGAFRNHPPGRLPSSRLITKLRLTFIPRDSASLTKILKRNA